MYRMLATIAALFIIWLGAPTTAHAQYYVCGSNCAQGGANGSDASSSCSAGTISAPFATPTHAQAVMAACSTKKTIIESGTYTLSTNWAFSSSDNGTTYAAYPGATPIISGGGSPGTSNPRMYFPLNTNNITIKGITFQNLGSGGTGVDTGYPGASIAFVGNATTNNNFVFQYNTMINCTDACIHFSSASGAIVDSNKFIGVTIVSDVNAGSAVIGSEGTNNLTLSHNLCMNTDYACGDTSSNAGQPVPHDVIFDSNVVVNPCLTALSTHQGNQDCGALYIADRNQASTNMVIKNNVISGAATGVHDNNTDITNCIYLDDGVTNVTMTGNLCFNDAGQYAIHYHGNKNTTASNNVFVIQGSEAALTCNGTNQKACPGEIVFYQTAAGISGVTDPSTMSGNVFTNNEIIFMGDIDGRYETGGTPTNFLSVSGNMYYSSLGNTFKNKGDNAGHMIDSSPIYCGPSMGTSPSGNISPQALWGMLASGAISTWQQIRTNQGPTFRSCAAGQF